MKAKFFFFALLSWLFMGTIVTMPAQVLYSKPLTATEILGVWTNGEITIESPNAIASNINAKYVASNLFKYKNIRMIYTEKFEYKDKTWYIWEIDYLMSSTYSKKGFEYMTNYLALTEAQNNKLKNVSTKDVSIVQIPCFGTMTMIQNWKPEQIIEGVKKAILEKDDFSAHTYTITARKEDDCILFNYEVDTWTHNGNINNRTYEKLDLKKNLDGGYFKIPEEHWCYLFFR